MSEWKMSVLGDIAYLQNKLVEPTKIALRKYIGLEHIEQGGLVLSGYGMSSDVDSVKNTFEKNDILFGKLRPYFRKVIYAPFDGICSTDIWVIKSRKDVHQRFLYYIISSQEFVDFATKGSDGTRMPRAKWEFVKNFAVALPPLAEQQAIAEMLGALDDKIEINRQMNESLEAIARALFKSWFVDFKYPGHEDVPLANSELGMIPQEWRVSSLDQIANFQNGLALQKFPPETELNFLPVIKIRELRQGYVDTNSDKASSNIKYTFIVNDGDVLFAWSGSLMVDLWCGGMGALNQHLFKLTSSTYPKWFFLHWTKHHLGRFIEIAADKATTMGHIQRHHLSSSYVLVPPQDVLISLDQFIAPILEKVIDSRIESRSLMQMRDTLLPKLMSGEIRVGEV